MTDGRLFTIPPGVPFLPTLARALVDGRLAGLDDLFGLGDATIYLPTRRAARAFSAVLAQTIGKPTLLPRIVPLGEADAAELDLAGAAFEGGAEALAPPIPPLERRLILARLVRAWAKSVDRDLLPLGPDVPFLVPSSPADAIGLAADLEGLMDSLTVEGIPFAEMAGAIDAEYSRYFGLTLDFVKIAAAHWPGILAERDVGDPATRSRLLVMAEADRLARERPSTPFVVAGSTGSVPATARLIAAIAKLPNGSVVLPGLDLDLDPEGWAAITPAEGRVHGHPQAILHRLLGSDFLATDRSRVRSLGTPSPALGARAHLLSDALRPADTTDLWVERAERLVFAQAGTEGLAVVEAADEREEALAIAIALRETLEVPGAVAALITPDRGLAGRVAAELRRWGIVADDTAGTPLASSPAGQVARLAADVAAFDARPQRVLALLAHPWVTLGLDRPTVEQGAAALEMGVLRGPAPAKGFGGLRRAVAAPLGPEGRAPLPRRRLTADDHALAALLVDRLASAFEGFAETHGDRDLVAIAARHRLAVERLIEGTTAADASLEVLDGLFDDLELADAGGLDGRFGDYPAVFAALARDRMVVRRTGDAHPRLRILGLLEARLLSVDRVVLAGLDEGIWPPRAETDAFLNRPMRHTIGLPPPERRIGQTAHDFVQALGCADAVITRAGKRDGSPMVPSRFLQRLRAFVGEAAWARCVAAGERLRDLAAVLDGRAQTPQRRFQRPSPRPPAALFPRQLSVTEIETLIRDPYAIFARHVLRLDPLEPVAVVPNASDRGTIVHAILGGFATEFPQALPADAEAALLQRAQDAFARIADDYPELYAEWWPRFERLSARFMAWETERRPDLTRVHAEVSGRWTLPIGAQSFTLTARADRIEARPGGGFCIVDFKTGQVPSTLEVFAGFSPQLTLEAAMLMNGAFRGLPRTHEAPDLLYVRASGGRIPLEPRLLAPTGKEARSVADIVSEHRQGLERLVARFMAGEAGYPSRPFPKYVRAFSAYDHLARVKEWSLAGDEEA